MSKWKRRLAAIEQAEREAQKRAHDERIHHLRGVLWHAETEVLANPDAPNLPELKAQEAEARHALREALDVTPSRSRST
jgi:hypothetical protein